MKYKYHGTEELHLPQHKITVQPGDITPEVTEEIHHPEFKLLKEQEGKPKKK